MEVKAKLRFARVSPKKARLVLKGLIGRAPQEVTEELKFLPKKSAVMVKKIIDSAVSNAKNNFNLDPKNLIIKKITADSGPTQKRYWMRSRGQVDVLRKRSTHFTVVLTEKESSVSSKKRSVAQENGKVKTAEKSKTSKKASNAVKTSHAADATKPSNAAWADRAAGEVRLPTKSSNDLGQPTTK